METVFLGLWHLAILQEFLYRLTITVFNILTRSNLIVAILSQFQRCLKNSMITNFSKMYWNKAGKKYFLNVWEKAIISKTKHYWNYLMKIRFLTSLLFFTFGLFVWKLFIDTTMNFKILLQVEKKLRLGPILNKQRELVLNYAPKFWTLLYLYMKLGKIKYILITMMQVKYKIL